MPGLAGPGGFLVLGLHSCGAFRGDAAPRALGQGFGFIKPDDGSEAWISAKPFSSQGSAPGRESARHTVVMSSHWSNHER